MSKEAYFRKKILRWFPRNKRNFFWRHKPDPYVIFVTEVFLKKTSAPYAENFIKAFIKKFSSPKSLSKARLYDLKKFFKKLGLIGRAKDLKKSATQMCDKHRCRVPKKKEELRKIHLIGDYTCNAILSFAYGEREPIVDTNVIRIYRRYFSLSPNVRAHTDKNIWNFARRMLPKEKNKSKYFNWALLDFGALVCTARNPRCTTCPVRNACSHKDKRR